MAEQTRAAGVAWSSRLRAASHEVRCRECRVTWRSWWQRLTDDQRGYTPEWEDVHG